MPYGYGSGADQAAQKIKADLIERAKLKKNYAKVLKAEGMESGRLQDRSGARKSRTGGEDGSEAEGEGEGEGKQDAVNRAPRSNFDRKGKGRATDNQNTPAEPPIPTAQRKRALSPSDIGAAMELSELKILKEKAYAKPSRTIAGNRGRVAQGGSVRGSRGQPNMGARMGVLLEQIKAGRK